jgi:hypothetical protein
MTGQRRKINLRYFLDVRGGRPTTPLEVPWAARSLLGEPKFQRRDGREAFERVLLPPLLQKPVPRLNDAVRGLRGTERLDRDGQVVDRDGPLGTDQKLFGPRSGGLIHLVGDIRRPLAALVAKRDTGCTDDTEEATFCQGLKSRIKKKWVLSIDRIITTTNKGDRHRLRGYAESYLCG